jgi:hypothetical protein
VAKKCPRHAQHEQRRDGHGVGGELEGLDEFITTGKRGQWRDREGCGEKHRGTEAQPPKLVRTRRWSLFGGPDGHRARLRWKNPQKQTNKKNPSGIARVRTCGPKK